MSTPETWPARSIIAAISVRRPGMSGAKLEQLLFFAQGHHLAWRGRPLFEESLYAVDGGVALAGIPDWEAPTLRDEGALNTVGYVVERYAALAPADLRALIQASDPWRSAHGSPGRFHPIKEEELREWFLRPDEANDPADERPNLAVMAEARRFWQTTNTRRIR